MITNVNLLHRYAMRNKICLSLHRVVVSILRSGYDLRPICMGFEVDKVALGQVSLKVPLFFHASITRQTVRTHLVTYHRRCINLARLRNKVCRLRINTDTAVCRNAEAVGVMFEIWF